MNPSDKISYFKASLVDMDGVINNEPANQPKQTKLEKQNFMNFSKTKIKFQQLIANN